MSLEKKWEKIKNLTVEEFTTPCPKVVSPNTALAELERLIQEEGFRHIPVEDKGKVVGIISERDIFSTYRSENNSEMKAEDIMHKDPYTVHSDTKISEVAFHMSTNKYGSALVSGNGGELGIFTSTDALNALVEVLRGDILTDG